MRTARVDKWRDQCFNTASGNTLHAIACPGSRGITGLKIGVWKVPLCFSVIWNFLSWTLFHFSIKNSLHILYFKASRCPQIFWKGSSSSCLKLYALFHLTVNLSLLPATKKPPFCIPAFRRLTILIFQFCFTSQHNFSPSDYNRYQRHMHLNHNLHLPFSLTPINKQQTYPTNDAHVIQNPMTCDTYSSLPSISANISTT